MIFTKITIDLDDSEALAKALSSKTRRFILKILRKEPGLFISEIADRVGQSESNISAQIEILSNCGLVATSYTKGEHGTRKTCRIAGD